MPTLANLVLWRSNYVAENRIHADGIRIGPLSTRTYRGESVPLVVPAQDIQWAPPGSPARVQAERFAHLSDGYLVWHPRRHGMLGDGRFAMLPTRVEPLWGLAFAEKSPAAEVSLVTDRTLTPEMRKHVIVRNPTA